MKHRTTPARDRTIRRWAAIERAAWIAAVAAAVLAIILDSTLLMILGGTTGIVGVIANDLVTTLEAHPHHRIEDNR